jgi:hypothetical protein
VDPRDRLRLALIGSGCVRCGQPYAPGGIKVLAQRDEIAFVQLVCFACQVQTLALVTGIESIAREGDAEEPEGGAEDLEGSGEGAEAAGRPDGKRAGRATAGPEPRAISQDDVLEMRSFLAGYEGDIHRLLDRSSDRPNAGRRDRESHDQDGRDRGPEGGRSGDRPR